MAPLITQQILSTVRSRDPWCTPNVLPQPKVDPLEDISVSAGEYGSLVDDTGVFGAATRGVADVLEVDGVLFSVGGSTLSNHVVAWSLVRRFGPAPVVAVAANAHLSVVNAAMQQGLRLRHLAATSHRGTILPPSPRDVESLLGHLEQAGEPADAVWITSPTYEGFAADVTAIARIAKAHGCVLVVDEAWGAHSGLIEGGLPCAYAAGADVVTTSVHKTAGALQGGGLLMWRDAPTEDGRTVTVTMREAYKQVVSTSPSYHIAASVEHAVHTLHAEPQLLQAPVAMVAELKDRLRAADPRLGFLEDQPWDAAHVVATDPLRTTVDLSSVDVSGTAVASALCEAGIIVEKSSSTTVTFIGTFRLGAEAPARAAAAIAAVTTARDTRVPTEAPMSRRALPLLPVMELAEVARAPRSHVPIARAAGSVAAAPVGVYPPGIPLLLPGHRITQAQVDELDRLARCGERVFGADQDLAAVPVVATSGAPGSLAA